MAEIVTMPKLGFDMAEGTLVRWVVQEGEPVKKGAVLAEIETDKATVEVESAFDGIVARHLVPAGEIVPVNTPIAVVAAPGESLEEIAAAGEKAPEAKAPSGETRPAPEGAPAGVPATAAPPEGQLPGRIKASPLARRMAAEMRINLQAVPGSGPGGRIIKKDIEAFLAAPAAAAAAPAPAAPAPAAPAPAAPIPAVAKAAPPPIPLAPLAAIPTPADEVVPLNRLRAAIGRRMVEAKQQVPHFYVTHDYDVAALLDLRKQANDLLPDEEKISVNDFIIKATALALRQFPNLNASFQGEQIVRHGAVNIGVAVAVEGGLLTVVCRDADRKPLRQIAVEVRAMAARARDGKVRPEDIEGSTFSISNLGMFDVEHFIAIINPPEAAILAIGSAREIPVVKNGQIQPGWRMKATVSVDHRVSDGAEGARFMQALAAYLEQPLRLLV
jgi:pyruvate dehydrogenase E2 component (dihydrolipoamide acetyltransferase)